MKREKKSLPKWSRWLITVGVGQIIAFIPRPSSLEPSAWYGFAVFVATIVGFIVQAAPIGVISLVALVLVAVLNIAPIETVLASFSSTTAWLIFFAFVMARALQKTGLGRRIALTLIKLIGKSSLTLTYALVASEAILATSTPSIMARSGGTMYPIAMGICDVYGSKPGESGSKIGNYLVQTENQIACVCSAMFMTGMASNPLVVSLALSAAGLSLAWMDWFLAALVPGLLSLITIPLVMYKLEPPDIKKTPEAREMAINELKKMGPMTRYEKIDLTVFILCLLGWATGSLTGLNATTVGMIAGAILLLTGVLSWDDLLGEKKGWDSFFWIAALMQLASIIQSGGVIDWFANTISPIFANMPWLLVLILVSLIYMYAQYFFASMTSHITALYAAMLLTCISAGVPPMLAALVLAMFSNLCGGLTHYAGGHSPMWFNAGYVSQNTWWKNGFICSLVNAVWFIGVGALWWKIIGMY